MWTFFLNIKNVECVNIKNVSRLQDAGIDLINHHSLCNGWIWGKVRCYLKQLEGNNQQGTPTNQPTNQAKENQAREPKPKPKATNQPARGMQSL